MSGWALLPTLLGLGLALHDGASGAEAPGPIAQRVAVQEVFDDGLLLLSVGSGRDAKKGDRVQLFRLQPKPMYIGEVEVTAVGNRFVLARPTKGRLGLRPRVGDLAERTPHPFEDADSVPGQKLRGGAILDKR